MSTSHSNRAHDDYQALRTLLLIELLAFPFLLLMIAFMAPIFGVLGMWILILSFVVLTLFIIQMVSLPLQSDRHLEVISPEKQPSAVRDVMNVELATTESGFDRFRGHLKESAQSAYEKLARFFAPKNRVPLLQEDEELGASVVVIPKGEATLSKPSKVTPWLLFILTLISTTVAGAAYAGADLGNDLSQISLGLPYSFGLMSILGVHELGHFLAARRHNINVTPPYFIPVPFALGTFGAFIQMRSPPDNRKALFDVAVAGPLAGLAVAIPVLWIGLQSSTVIAVPPEGLRQSSGIMGSSFLFSLIAHSSLDLPGEVSVGLQLSPMAFAGWLGLVVTALNLVPVGQLDGGHIVYSLCGRRLGNMISSIATWSLFLLALFVWPGLMLWAILVFFMAGRPTTVLNELTPLAPWQKALGVVTMIIFFLIIIPNPVTLGLENLWSSAYL